MNETEELAMLFHVNSDHGKNGSALGDHICNCTDTTARVIILLKQIERLKRENEHLLESNKRLDENIAFLLREQERLINQ